MGRCEGKIADANVAELKVHKGDDGKEFVTVHSPECVIDTILHIPGCNSFNFTAVADDSYTKDKFAKFQFVKKAKD